jgi:hypothetical protein
MNSGIGKMKLQPFSLTKLNFEKHFSIMKDELDSEKNPF